VEKKYEIIGSQKVFDLIKKSIIEIHNDDVVNWMKSIFAEALNYSVDCNYDSEPVNGEEYIFNYTKLQIEYLDSSQEDEFHEVSDLFLTDDDEFQLKDFLA
jgi:hypothetical protein